MQTMTPLWLRNLVRRASRQTRTHSPDSLRIEWATKSACLSVLRTPVVRNVGVMSLGGSFTGEPNTYTTLEEASVRQGQRVLRCDWLCVRHGGVRVSYLLMLWHMRGMSLARNMRESQCGDSLLVTPHT